MHTCPSAATLPRFATDSLDGAAFAAAEKHIDDCDLCRSRLERLSQNDAEAEAAVPSLPSEASATNPRLRD